MHAQNALLQNPLTETETDSLEREKNTQQGASIYLMKKINQLKYIYIQHLHSTTIKRLEFVKFHQQTDMKAAIGNHKASRETVGNDKDQTEPKVVLTCK